MKNMDKEKINIKEFEKITSTHIYVKENKENLKSGSVIIAKTQTKGIGTHGRSWYTGKDNIAMSILYKPKCDYSKIEGITNKIAKCIQNTIDELYNIELTIKYPNDLLLNDKKICGILTEINTISEKINYLIISIGFNVNEINFNKEINDIATSLKKEYKREFDRNEIIFRIINNIQKLMIQSNII